MMDEDFKGIMCSDMLRDMLLNEESEYSELFSEEEQKEVRRGEHCVCEGGEHCVCAREESIMRARKESIMRARGESIVCARGEHCVCEGGERSVRTITA
jgi:hypothetical protein